MSNLLEKEPETSARRRTGLIIGVAAPLALAAAAVGAAVVIPHMSNNGPAPAIVVTRPAPVAAGTKTPVTRISNYIKTASYTLQREPGDMIKVAVRFSNGRPDGDGLKADLAKMGVTIQVYQGFPKCTPQIINLATRDKNGDFVASVPVKVIADYPEAIVFAEDPAAIDADDIVISIGTGTGPQPTCGVAPPLPAGHTPVAETTVD
ncbi:hypothetical protein J5X84_24325 [Streptosporangiaceae bacterium NEAU-GS5]|nr:hypothetical protein [Streptosporangiaceae bacterium NEAU-GS5]